MTTPKSPPESIPTDGMQFFTPVSVGILVQLFCAGLVIAVTAALSLSTSSRNPPGASDETSTAASDDQGDPSNPSEQVAAAAASAPADVARTPDNSGSANEPATATETSAANTTGESAIANTTNPASATPDSGSEGEMTAEQSEASAEDSEAAAAGSTPVASARALEDVRQKNRKLPLAGEGLSDEIELCKIFAQDPSTVTLELIGGEFTVPEQIVLSLKPFPVDAKSHVWKVSQKSTIGLARNQEIGEFVLKDQQLRFRWFRNMDKGMLPFCRLRISAGADSEVCDLWSVARSGAAKVRFAKSEQVIDELVPSGIRLPPFDILELDLTLVNWPEHKVSGEKLMFNETITVTFPDEESNRDLITLMFSLDKKEGRYALRGEYFFSAPGLPSRGKGKRDVRYEEEKLTEDQLKKTSDSLKSSAAKLEKELDSVQQILTALNDRQAALTQQIANGGDNALRATLLVVSNQIAARSTEETDLENTLEQVESAMTAMEKVKSLCEEIVNEGSIQYRLFRPFAGDGGDVVIAATVTEPAAVEENR